MGTQTVAKIPVVNFSNEDCLKPGTSSWLTISKSICHALEELGCFVAVLPGKVSPELHDTFFGTLGELFDFPTEIKVQSAFEKPYPSGYITAKAAHEGLAIGYATNPEDTRRFTHHFWPEGHDSFREGADLYAKVMEELNQVVTRMVFENYGVEKYHDDHIQSIVYTYRFNQYKEFDKTGIDEGLPAHTDKTFSTTLYQNHVKGLEIYSKDNEWIGVDPLPSSFIFLAGDGFQVWSNDRVRACKHRGRTMYDTRLDYFHTEKEKHTYPRSLWTETTPYSIRHCISSNIYNILKRITPPLGLCIPSGNIVAFDIFLCSKDHEWIGVGWWWQQRR